MISMKKRFIRQFYRRARGEETKGKKYLNAEIKRIYLYAFSVNNIFQVFIFLSEVTFFLYLLSCA